MWLLYRLLPVDMLSPGTRVFDTKFDDSKLSVSILENFKQQKRVWNDIWKIKSWK